MILHSHAAFIALEQERDELRAAAQELCDCVDMGATLSAIRAYAQLKRLLPPRDSEADTPAAIEKSAIWSDGGFPPPDGEIE